MQSRRLSPFQPLKNQQHHPSLIIRVLKPVEAPDLIFQGLHPSLITFHASLIRPKKFASCGLTQALLQASETLVDASSNLLAHSLRQHHGWQGSVRWEPRNCWLASGRDQCLGLQRSLAFAPRLDEFLVMLPMVVGFGFSSLRRSLIAALPLAFQPTTGFLVVAMTVIGRKAFFTERANFAAQALVWHRAKPFLQLMLSVKWVSGRRALRSK